MARNCKRRMPRWSKRAVRYIFVPLVVMLYLLLSSQCGNKFPFGLLPLLGIFPVCEPASEQNRHHLSSSTVAASAQKSTSDRTKARENEQYITSVCPGYLRRPPTFNIDFGATGRYWQMQKQGPNVTFATSAFYDDRAVGGKMPLIRILAVSSLSTKDAVFCHVWYDDIDSPNVTQATVHSSGRGDSISHKRYFQYLYSCQLTTDDVTPTHVSLSYDRCVVGNTLLPVTLPGAKQEHEFGICVAVSFGSIDRRAFIEWMEFNQIFGVTEVNIYNASLTDDVMPVFDYYAKAGVLRVHQMPPPVPDYSKRGSKLASPASLNDCMLRNMYRYRYMVVIDFDELIVPKTHATYSQMLKFINKHYDQTSTHMSYTFRNEYYFREYDANQSQPQTLNTMRYRQHAVASAPFFAPKSFIDPRQCLSVFNHYCWIRFPGAPGQFTHDVKTGIATSRHYRRCADAFSQAKCQLYDEGKQRDETILRFEPELKTRVKRVTSVLATALL